MNIQDFIYLEDLGILFIALSDMNAVAKIDAYFTNFKVFWNKESETQSIIGGILCYRVNRGTWSFDRLWAKCYGSRISVLTWEGTTELLLIGTDEGYVNALKTSAINSYIDYKEVIKGNIVGIYASIS